MKQDLCALLRGNPYPGRGIVLGMTPDELTVYFKQLGQPAFRARQIFAWCGRGVTDFSGMTDLNKADRAALQEKTYLSPCKIADKFVSKLDGTAHDVGGPTADFRGPACKKQLTKGACPNRNCLFPEPCKNMVADHRDYVKLLRELKDIPGVKKVFIRSGIRFDYVLADKDQTFLSELVKDHVSGQLRVAPEHVSNRVLSYMGKPRHEVYQEFIRRFDACNKKTGKQQYALPYFMSSHPGCDLEDAVELAEYIRDMGFIPEQAQDFYPTPSTLSTCMYYTGLDPRTMNPVYVPKSPHEKAMQRALIH